jgi:hypothetical protein
MFRQQKSATIIAYMKQFELKTDPMGVCFGFTCEGIIAILSQEIHKFDTTIKLIFQRQPEALKQYISNKINKNQIAINQIKKDIGPFRELSTEELNWLHLEAKEELATLEDNLNEWAKENQQANALKERKDTFLFDLYLQKKIEDHFMFSSENKKIIVVIPDFLKRIALYHDPESFLELLDKGKTIFEIKNNILQLSPILPNSLKNQGGIEKVGTLMNAYHASDLNVYLQSLRDSFAETHLLRPVAFMLRSINHAIAIGYIPQTNRFYFINSSISVSFSAKNDDLNELSEKILASLSKNDTTCFSTEIYCARNNQPEVTLMMNAWFAKVEFQEIHAITQEKTKYIDSYQASLLHIALKMENIEMMELLLQTGADPNQKLIAGHTPLIATTQNCRIEFIQKLIAHGAKPNESLENGATALWFAAARGDTDIFHLLYKISADKNPILWEVDPLSNRKTSYTMLQIAELLKHHALVEILSTSAPRKNW